VISPRPGPLGDMHRFDDDAWHQTHAWPDRAIADLADRQRTMVTTAQLRELGITSRAIGKALARGRLHGVHHGVYSLVLRRSRPAFAAEQAALLACGARAVLSHHTAAVIHGLRAADRPGAAADQSREAHRGPGPPPPSPRNPAPQAAARPRASLRRHLVARRGPAARRHPPSRPARTRGQRRLRRLRPGPAVARAPGRRRVRLHAIPLRACRLPRRPDPPQRAHRPRPSPGPAHHQPPDHRRAGAGDRLDRARARPGRLR
jgi:hypothetical protein